MTLLKALTKTDQMILIRVVEDKLQELCNQGLGADLHFSKGQEAISVGVMSALLDTDYVVTHHRTIAHAIAKGVPLDGLLAELLGKATGINGGMAGEMHMSYPAKRFMFSFQLVGTCMPVAAGIAWAVKNYLKTNDIVVVFHGDAATANGQWHEGLNIAAVQKLPLLLICENNELAGNVRPEHYLPVEHIKDRAKAYGIMASSVDGNDVDEVYRCASIAIAAVRQFSKPYLLECRTTRLGKHKQGQGDLRGLAEMALLQERDPLRYITVDQRAQLDSLVNATIERVMAEPEPVIEEK